MIEQWDPLQRITERQAPPGEYDSLVAKIVGAVEQGIGPADLAHNIHETTEGMGLTLRPDEADEIAQTIGRVLSVFQNGQLIEVLHYEGYEVCPDPNQLADSGEWTLDLRISRDDGAGISAKSLSAQNTYRTREDAFFHCFDFGRKVINGEIEGCSVNDL